MRRDRPSVRWRVRALCGSLMALAAATGPLPGQQTSHGTLKRPAIGSHTFLSSDLVPDPLVRTYVRQSLGIAQAVDLSFPVGVIDGDTLALLEGDLTYAVLDVEYQHAVKDWLAARGRFNLRSRVGTEGSSLLTSGVEVSTGFEFGWLIRLVQSDRIALSLSADVAKRSFTVVDIRQFVKDVLAQAADPQLADHIPAVRGSGGLRFGWGISRLFGLTAVLDAGYGDAARRDRDGQFEYGVGTTLDFDLGAVTPVPIGIGLSYVQTSVIQNVSSDSDVRTAVVRIGYTGRPDFMIGLDLMGNAVRDLSVAGTVKSVGMILTTRYYF